MRFILADSPTWPLVKTKKTTGKNQKRLGISTVNIDINIFLTEWIFFFGDEKYSIKMGISDKRKTTNRVSM